MTDALRQLKDPQLTDAGTAGSMEDAMSQLADLPGQLTDLAGAAKELDQKDLD